MVTPLVYPILSFVIQYNILFFCIKFKILESKTKYSRLEFYELIWKKPIIHLAKEWGIPYHMLKSICERMHIPRPNSSYWSKINFGKNPGKLSLPQLDTDEVIDIVGLRTASKPKENEIKEKLEEVLSPVLKVRARTTNLDPLVLR